MQAKKSDMTHLSHLTLRRNLGLLGLFLPLLVFVINQFVLLPSISHYYYSHSNVMFIGVLFSFGLFLFSYKGYPKEKKEWLSDNLLTNFAGVCIVIVAFIPTTKAGCVNLLNAPNQHNDAFWGNVHLVCAAIFFVIMAWMSWFHFTKSDGVFEDEKDRKVKNRRNLIYKIGGAGVIASLLFIVVFGFNDRLYISDHTVFIGETGALIFFGTSWLVKSKSLSGIGI